MLDVAAQYLDKFPLDFHPPGSVHAASVVTNCRGIALPYCLPDVEVQIRSLKQAGDEAIRARWRAVFRKSFPAHLPRHLIVNLLAYELQAALSGDLTQPELRHLADADRDGKGIGRFDPDSTRHQLGTIFVREHAGILHRTVKTASGFEWNGLVFFCFCAVAFVITGTKWNGLRFFGVSGADKARRG